MTRHRPNFQRRRYHRPDGHPNGRRSSSSGFGILVAGAAALMFLGVFYGDRMPSALGSAIQFSHDLGRAHRPPPGAYYSNCNEARAAGVAPLYAGEPGYRPEMDGDDDGIACEPYRGM